MSFSKHNRLSAIVRRRDDRERNTTHACDHRSPHPLIDHGHLPRVVAAVAPTTAPTAATLVRRHSPSADPNGDPMGRRLGHGGGCGGYYLANNSRRVAAPSCAATRRLLRTVERRRSSPTRSSEGTDRKICVLAARGARAGRLGTTTGDILELRF